MKKEKSTENATEKVTPIGYVFWSCSLFPYALGSPATYKLGGNLYKVPEYGQQAQVEANHIAEPNAGLKIQKKLDLLAMEHQEALKAVTLKFKRKALKVAPFLESFPGYIGIDCPNKSLRFFK